jgi:hypothetical protein
MSAEREAPLHELVGTTWADVPLGQPELAAAGVQRARRQSKDPLEFYRTPEWVVRAILPYLPALISVCDPCAGDGAILDVFAANYRHAEHRGLEIDEGLASSARARGHVVRTCDALDPHVGWLEPDLYVMNPPFSLAEAFIRRALAEAAPHRATVAALVRLGFLETPGRARLHREYPSDLYVLAKRPSFTGKGTDASAYGWLVWGPGHGGRWAVLDDVDTTKKVRRG